MALPNFEELPGAAQDFIDALDEELQTVEKDLYDTSGIALKAGQVVIPLLLDLTKTHRSQYVPDYLVGVIANGTRTEFNNTHLRIRTANLPLRHNTDSHIELKRIPVLQFPFAHAPKVVFTTGDLAVRDYFLEGIGHRYGNRDLAFLDVYDTMLQQSLFSTDAQQFVP